MAKNTKYLYGDTTGLFNVYPYGIRFDSYIIDKNNRWTLTPKNQLILIVDYTAKEPLLELLERAYSLFWTTSPEIRSQLFLSKRYYYVTVHHTNDLCDLLLDNSIVLSCSNWFVVDNKSRRLTFRIQRLSIKPYKIYSYTVQDTRFVYGGAAYTARVIQPAIQR